MIESIRFGRRYTSLEAKGCIGWIVKYDPERIMKMRLQIQYEFNTTRDISFSIKIKLCSSETLNTLWCRKIAHGDKEKFQNQCAIPNEKLFLYILRIVMRLGGTYEHIFISFATINAHILCVQDTTGAHYLPWCRHCDMQLALFIFKFIPIPKNIFLWKYFHLFFQNKAIWMEKIASQETM